MKLWLIAILALASVSVASAQGQVGNDPVDQSTGSYGYFPNTFDRNITRDPIVQGSLPPLPPTSLVPPGATISIQAGSDQFSLNVTPIPEPAPSQLIGLGLGLFAMRRFFSRKK